MDNDVNLLCLACMQYTMDGSGVCTHCGVDSRLEETLPHHLPPRSVLNAKYLTARVLGEGGFGITYLGWDINLEIKVAIKEYYPLGAVTRNSTVSDQVTAIGGNTRDQFDQGRERFLDEARRLAKFYDLPGIVSVKDFFLENGTAYIVMEFVEGITLKDYLAKSGGRIAEAEALALMEPLVQSLSQVHSTGVIHRDISPDNIMLTPGGQLRLIDFGAARDFNSDDKSLSVLLKSGYAPEEQYRSRGNQGPWTDVYALSATIFCAIEGSKPPESMERMFNDTFTGFSVPVSPATSAALMKGLALRAPERWQDMNQLHAALYPLHPAEPAPQNPPPAQSAKAPPSSAPQKAPKKNGKSPLAILVPVAAALLIITVLATTLPGDDAPAVSSTAAAVSEDRAAAPPEGADGAPYSSLVVTRVGKSESGTYDGKIEYGLANGNGSWTWSNYRYEGVWKDGLPNGEGVLYEDPAPKTDLDGDNVLSTSLATTFVNGLAHGPAMLTWQMESGAVHCWKLNFTTGRADVDGEVTEEEGDATLTVSASTLYGVPPWDGTENLSSSGDIAAESGLQTSGVYYLDADTSLNGFSFLPDGTFFEIMGEFSQEGTWQIDGGAVVITVYENTLRLTIRDENTLTMADGTLFVHESQLS